MLIKYYLNLTNGIEFLENNSISNEKARHANAVPSGVLCYIFKRSDK